MQRGLQGRGGRDESRPYRIYTSTLLVEGEEEVGVDEGEEDEADAFDLDHDVFVFLDSLNVAFVAFVVAAGDAHFLVFPEILFGEYLAAGGVVGCEEAEQLYGALRDYLYPVVVGIAVDPEGYGEFGVVAAGSFESHGVFLGGLDEEDTGDDGPFAFLLVRTDHCLFRKVDLLAERRQEFFGLEVVSRLYREPFGGFG